MAVRYEERNNKRWAVKIGDWVYRNGIERYEATQIINDLSGAVNNVKVVHLSGGKHA